MDTYFLFSTLLMCVGIDASVPMPCCSINEMSSDSVIAFGGDVTSAASATFATGVASPTTNARANRVSRGARHGIASVHPGCLVSLAHASKSSPPTSRAIARVTQTQSRAHAATKRRTMKSYTRHASTPPTSAGDEAEIPAGVIGGWSPASTPPRGARNAGCSAFRVSRRATFASAEEESASASISATIASPRSGWQTHALNVSRKSNPFGNALDSVRGYEMRPSMYRRSAICITRCAPMPIPAEQDLSRSTVFKPHGGGFEVSASVDIETRA